MPKRDYTHLVLLLDRSFSFQSLKGEVLQGVNQFLLDQRALGGEVSLTLILFDNMVDYLVDGKPIKNEPLLTEQNYVPRNQTALLDAVGTALLSSNALITAMPEAEQPEMIVFIAISDGIDVASSTFTKKDVERNVRVAYENKGWELLFLLSDIDAEDIGDRMGVLKKQVLPFQHSGPGVLMALESLNRVVTDYRKLEVEGCEWTDEDKAKQEELA